MRKLLTGDVQSSWLFRNINVIVQEDPLLRLDRLQKQLAEAQAIVQSLPAPVATSNAGPSASDFTIAPGSPVSTIVKNQQQALGPQEGARDSSDILPEQQQAIRYPSLFDGGTEPVVSRHPQALPRANAKMRPIAALLQPTISNVMTAEKESPWSDQHLDLRSQHQRRRDALANAKERLAELQVCFTPGYDCLHVSCVSDAALIGLVCRASQNVSSCMALFPTSCCRFLKRDFLAEVA